MILICPIMVPLFSIGSGFAMWFVVGRASCRETRMPAVTYTATLAALASSWSPVLNKLSTTWTACSNQPFQNALEINLVTWTVAPSDIIPSASLISLSIFLSVFFIDRVAYIPSSILQYVLCCNDAVILYVDLLCFVGCGFILGIFFGGLPLLLL
jgi:hypothetical protein